MFCEWNVTDALLLFEITSTPILECKFILFEASYTWVVGVDPHEQVVLLTHFYDTIVVIRCDSSVREREPARNFVAEDKIDDTINIPSDCRRTVRLLEFGLTDRWTTKVETD